MKIRSTFFNMLHVERRTGRLIVVASGRRSFYRITTGKQRRKVESGKLMLGLASTVLLGFESRGNHQNILLSIGSWIRETTGIGTGV
jgi:hypothetical protein